MAKTVFNKVSNEVYMLVKDAKNPSLELRFLDPNIVLNNLNLSEDYLPLVMEVIKYSLKRAIKDTHDHYIYTDLGCWDGDRNASDHFTWKYLKHHESETCHKTILDWYNDYLPENRCDFEIGDEYIPYDGSFSLWLDAPDIETAKHYSEKDETNAKFKVVSKPYWCMKTDKYLLEPNSMINMVDVVSLKTGRTYRFLNANYDKSRFDKTEQKRRTKEIYEYFDSYDY